jgi:hypothetical protein
MLVGYKCATAAWSRVRRGQRRHESAAIGFVNLVCVQGYPLREEHTASAAASLYRLRSVPVAGRHSVLA